MLTELKDPPSREFETDARDRDPGPRPRPARRGRLQWLVSMFFGGLIFFLGGGLSIVVGTFYEVAAGWTAFGVLCIGMPLLWHVIEIRNLLERAEERARAERAGL